jgi:hypothetical protein
VGVIEVRTGKGLTSPGGQQVKNNIMNTKKIFKRIILISPP